MDIETIAFFALGGTKKSGESVGGLGKAKEMLYFSEPEWMISSKGVIVTGSGSMYSIRKTLYRAGVTGKIGIGNHISNPLSYIKNYLACGSLGSNRLEFYCNGERSRDSGCKSFQ